jgi:hypothetical protein
MKYLFSLRTTKKHETPQSIMMMNFFQYQHHQHLHQYHHPHLIRIQVEVYALRIRLLTIAYLREHIRSNTIVYRGKRRLYMASVY